MQPLRLLLLLLPRLLLQRLALGRHAGRARPPLVLPVRRLRRGLLELDFGGGGVRRGGARHDGRRGVHFGRGAGRRGRDGRCGGDLRLRRDRRGRGGDGGGGRDRRRGRDRRDGRGGPRPAGALAFGLHDARRGGRPLELRGTAGRFGCGTGRVRAGRGCAAEGGLGGCARASSDLLTTPFSGPPAAPPPV